MAGALLAAALAPLGSTSISVGLPIITEALKLRESDALLWLVTSYLLITLIGQVPGGRAADLYGATRSLYLGISFVVVGCSLAYAFPQLEMLTFARVAMASGCALMGPACMVLMRTQLPLAQRARAFGLFGTTMSGAATLGPWLGGVLITHFSWPALFLINVPWAIAAAILVFLASETKVQKPEKTEPFDFLGLVLLSSGLVFLQLGMGGEGISWWMLMLSFLVLTGFVFYETRKRSPIFDPRLMLNPIYAGSGVMMALNNVIMYTLLFQIPWLVNMVAESSALAVGEILLVMMTGMMIAGFLSGRMNTSRMGTQGTLILASLLSIVAIFLLSQFDSMVSTSDFILPMSMIGFATGLVNPTCQFLATNSVETRIAGMAAGGISTFRYLGGIVGIALFSWQLGSGGDNPASHATVIFIFQIAAVIMLVTALAMRNSNFELRSS